MAEAPIVAPERLEKINVDELRPHERNPRTHSKKQIRQIADSIRRFGFTNPVLVDAENRIIAGHGRLEAARLLGLGTVPVLRLEHMTDAERRAYAILNAGTHHELEASQLRTKTTFGAAGLGLNPRPQDSLASANHAPDGPSSDQ